MRRFFFAVSLSAALPSLLFAQHTGTTAAAPSAGPHAAAPTHAGAPAVTSHSASAGHPTVHRSGTGTHTGSAPNRISNRPTSGPVKTPIAAPKAAWELGLPPNPIAPIPSSLAYANSVPTLLPFGHRCFGGFGCFGNQHFRNTGVIIPFGGFGGFYIPVPYYEPYSDDQGDQAEAASNDVQASDQNDNNNTADNYARNQQATPDQTAALNAERYYPPTQPVYDFVFVKRDGTKIFAVAYSLTKDKLQYVTREGLRRTLSLDSLDFEATQKSNEERGNTINLPTPLPAAMAAL